MPNTSQPAALEARAQALVAQRRIPLSTYRFQFNKDFTFNHARALVPYLHDLGVTHVYASPLLKAVPGSMHGYDICDHSQLNPEIGTMADFEAFSAALKAHGMSLVVDIVPNHMGISDSCNGWWMDVLENGPGSRYASYFDITWEPVKPELANKVLLPVLEDQYGNVLDSGKFSLAFEGGAFHITYGSHDFPIAPRTYRYILEPALERLTTAPDAASDDVQELQSILTAMSYLPARTEADAARLEERQREKEVIKRRLATLYDTSAAFKSALHAAVASFNGTPGDPRSFDPLDYLLSEQPYRAAFWRVAGEEINYRRFFDVNTMAALRAELPDVFAATHDLIFRLVAAGHITGLRVDHPDGLWNPTRYFRQLQETYLQYALQDDVPSDDRHGEISAWLDRLYEADGAAALPLYVTVEKILTENEPLPSDWRVNGTTGYDFMNQVNGIFVDTANEAAFNTLYTGFVGDAPPFHNLEYAMKRMIMQDSLASEINLLAHRLERIDEKNRHYRDFTLNGILHAIREVIACMAIYRTYITSPDVVSQRDQRFVEAAVREAKRRNPGTSPTIFNFVRDILLLRNLHDFAEADRQDIVDFVMRFQQMTGPVMAKSVEDTAFYRYNRLVSLNEVGGSPSQFGITLEAFHKQNQQRWTQWRYAMLGSSTHDTKRSEDVRARLNVLSELPDEWQTVLATWRELNASKKTETDDGLAPDANDEYLLYQSLIGAFPLGMNEAKPGDAWTGFCERIAAYMSKATKEAKAHSSWTNANDAYDQAVADFVSALLDSPQDNPFLSQFIPFQRRVAFYGTFNALSQTLLKQVSPGVPDTYRGAEIWDFSLVDPDNRRPVDYDQISAMLADLRQRSEQPGYDCGELADELLRSSDDGRIKLYLTYTLLTYRRDHDALFLDGTYEPLAAAGARSGHVCAFARLLDNEGVIAVAPRLVVGLTEGVERPPIGEVWGDTWLALPERFAGQTLTDVFTAATIPVTQRDGSLGVSLSDVLSRFPVALLTTM